MMLHSRMASTGFSLPIITCTPRSSAILESRSTSRALSSKQRAHGRDLGEIWMVQDVGGAAQVERPLAEERRDLVEQGAGAGPERIQRVRGGGDVFEDLAEGLPAIT